MLGTSTLKTCEGDLQKLERVVQSAGIIVTWISNPNHRIDHNFPHC